MKRIPFPLNDKDFIIEFHKTREGPSGFMCYYKNAATYRLDPLEAWRTLGVAKFTDTGKQLKAWCLQMVEVEEHSKHAEPGRDSDRSEPVQPDGVPEHYTNTFFDHHKEEEPSDNTKMVL